MKRKLAALLSTALLLTMVPITAAAADSVTLPEGTSHTVTLEYDASSVGGQDYDYQDVTIQVTFDGYLAQIESYDSSAYTEEKWYSSDPIYVVEKGSTVTFKIISDDALASYNYLAEVSLPKSGVDTLYDGGAMGNGCTSYEAWNPLWPGASAEYPGAVTYMSAGQTPLVINQVNSTTYSFTPFDGLSSVGFSSTYKLSSTEIADLFDTDSSEVGFFGFLYNYQIANILAVDQGDIDELAANGTAVIADSLENYVLTSGSEKQGMAYPGLLEAFGGTVAYDDQLGIYIEDMDDYMKVTITNNTGEAVSGTYGLMSYWTDVRYTAQSDELNEKETAYVYLFEIEVDLAQGESMVGTEYMVPGGWSTMNHVWITFDDAAECDSFIADSYFKFDGVVTDTFPMYSTTSADGADVITWMKSTFGITLISSKP